MNEGGFDVLGPILGQGNRLRGGHRNSPGAQGQSLLSAILTDCSFSC